MEWFMKMGRYKTRSLKERFLKKIYKTNGCWEWTAYKNRGYGRINAERPPNKKIRAHRLAYELFVGPIPKGMDVLHKCDNPSCVNPNHLFLGTHADNMTDRNLKGRQAFGERHGRAKLTLRQVKEIRRLYKPRSCEFGSGALSERYGVSHTTILDIVKREKWKGVN